MSNEVKNYVKKLRSDYSKMELRGKNLNSNPLQQFENWFTDAIKAELIHPQSMSIATVDETGQPSVRVVFLRDFDERGFVFYTNYLSAKGHDLAVNNKICANFFWPELERQIKIEGIVEKISEEESTEYFNTRPKTSQIGAWASHQSSVIKNRAVLDSKVENLNEEYKNKAVDKPKDWGGYLIKAHLIEFWQGRPSRLHDRFQYTKNESGWQIDRLSP